jgi:hypothetical protein
LSDAVSLLEAFSAEGTVDLGGWNKLDCVAGAASLLDGAKGRPNGLFITGSLEAVDGLSDEANGVCDGVVPVPIGCCVLVTVPEALLKNDGVAEEVDGANGLTAGFLAAEAKPEAKGFD